MGDIRFDEVRVVVTDGEGKMFSRDWKATADPVDAIKWTIESRDLPYIINRDTICSVQIISGEEA